jgi:hypothetical protein
MNLEHAAQRTLLSVHVRVSLSKSGNDLPNFVYALLSLTSSH